MPLLDAERFFKRRGGAHTLWKNSARQVLQSPPDWDCVIRHVAVPALLLGARDDKTTSLRGCAEVLDALPTRALPAQAQRAQAQPPPLQPCLEPRMHVARRGRTQPT